MTLTYDAKYDELLSSFAFNFNFGRYTKGHVQHMAFPSCMAAEIENFEAQVREQSFATQSATPSATHSFATRVRLAGLRGSANLNGREGDVRGRALQL